MGSRNYDNVIVCINNTLLKAKEVISASVKKISCYKTAFTLAEVMIVITLLGVIAAISIPSAINNVSQRETILRVKRTYSLLSNAYAGYMSLNHKKIPPQEYSRDGATNVANAFLQFMAVNKDIGTSPAEKRRYMYTGKYTNLRGTDGYNIYVDRESYYLVELKYGGQIWFKGIEDRNNPNGIAAEIFYDVNGKKGPNSKGHDLFAFNVVGDSIVPCGFLETYDYFDSACNIADADSSGFGCAAWIIKNGNMDYLKCSGLSLTDTKCH